MALPNESIFNYAIIFALLQRPLTLFQKLYKIVFWIGYTATLLTAFLPIAGDLSKTRVHALAFDIRLDHLLHFGAYLLICLYYLAGRKPGYRLFKSNPLMKFVMAVLMLATVTEVVQLWVPERAFNPFDLLADLTGVAVGTVGILIEDRRSKIKSPRSVLRS